MFRLAMLGYWHVHARDYEREARAHPDTDVVAVWDDDPDRGVAAAQAIGARFVPDLETLLANLPGDDDRDRDPEGRPA